MGDKASRQRQEYDDTFDIILQDPRAAPVPLPLDFLKTITGDFAEENELGHGGFGVVYKGVLRNGKAIAVKRLKILETNLDDEQYQKELRNLFWLHHKNIVQFKGYCAESSQVPLPPASQSQQPNNLNPPCKSSFAKLSFLLWPLPLQHIISSLPLDDFSLKFRHSQERDHCVLAEIRERLLCFEYVSNKSLREHISDASYGLEWLLRFEIIKGICSGLHYLHMKRDTAHMDLKPENILLDDNMVPKISDFGTLRLFHEDESRIITKNCVGTVGYAAPEYINQGMISKKADIFSFGVIMLELLTGSRFYPQRRRDFTQFTKNVVDQWSERLPNPFYTRQVHTCITIALKCVDDIRDARPDTTDIIKKLNEVQDPSNSWSRSWVQKTPKVVAIGVGAMVPIILNPSRSWSCVVTALNVVVMAAVTFFVIGGAAVSLIFFLKLKNHCFSSRPRVILFTIGATLATVLVLQNPSSILATNTLGSREEITLKFVIMAGVTLLARGVVAPMAIGAGIVLGVLFLVLVGLVARVFIGMLHNHFVQPRITPR